MINDYGYIPPHIIELENEVLGSLIESNLYHDLIFAELNSEDFYKVANKTIFESALKLHKQGLPIDTITLIQELRKEKQFEEIGGSDYILKLTNNLSTTANLEYHIRLLKDISITRSALMLFNSNSKSICDQNLTGKEILASTIVDCEKLLNRINKTKPKTFKESYIETLKNLGNNQSEYLGLSTGFKKLDSITSGLCGPDLTVIAAGPGEGKSTLALNIATHVSMNAGKVLIFSYEMKEEQLIYKIISSELNIPVLDVRKGKLPNDYSKKCKVYNANLKIFDSGEHTIDEIVSISKSENIFDPVKLVIIDYLQLVPVGMYGAKGQTRNDIVGIISRQLKKLAMSLNIPVIVLSQLNRDKNRHTYRLHDLRDSGSIEQDADNVLFIWRPIIHDQVAYQIGNTELISNNQTSIIIIEKCRLGETGEFEMKFLGNYSRFEDVETGVSDKYINNKTIEIEDNNFTEDLPF